jgi:hypothetical protein
LIDFEVTVEGVLDISNVIFIHFIPNQEQLYRLWNKHTQTDPGKSTSSGKVHFLPIRWHRQGPHLLVKMKFKDFSRTFKDLFQYIQGPGNWKNL